MLALADWVDAALWKTLPDGMFARCTSHLDDDLRPENVGPQYLHRDTPVVKLACALYLGSHDGLSHEEIVAVLLHGEYQANPRLGSFLHVKETVPRAIVVLNKRPSTLDPNEASEVAAFLRSVAGLDQPEVALAAGMLTGVNHLLPRNPGLSIPEELWDSVWEAIERHVSLEKGLLSVFGLAPADGDHPAMHIDFEYTETEPEDDSRREENTQIRFKTLPLAAQRELLVAYAYHPENWADDAELFEKLLVHFESV